MSFYLMHRGWMSTPALTAGHDPFCRRAAWVWLIEEAAWTDRSVDIAGRTVVLRRGQLSHSIRFMAEAWKWSRSAVERFVARLQAETMIETATGFGQLVITVCNYDHYQTPFLPSEAQAGTARGTAPGQRRDSAGTNYKEGNQGKEVNRQDATHPVSAEPTSPAPCDLFPGAAVVSFPKLPVEQAVASWNDLAEELGLSKVKALTGARQASLRNRLRECGGIDGWNDVLAEIRRCPHLLGENDRQWKADFDFVLQPKSFTKLREGTYSNRGKGRARPSKLAGWHDHFGTPEDAFPSSSHDIDGFAEVLP